MSGKYDLLGTHHVELYVGNAKQAAYYYQKAWGYQLVAYTGPNMGIAAVKASDEDRRRGWTAQRAIDGSMDEPAGYWLTQKTHPKSAWLELTLARALVFGTALENQQVGAAKGEAKALLFRIESLW